MNRILIGSGNNKIEKLVDDEIIVNIDYDCNILINNNSNIKKYIFNIKDAKVNILNLREKDSSKVYNLNIKKGTVSFNSVSYSSDGFNMNVDLNDINSSIVFYNSVIAIDKSTYDIKVNHYSSNTMSNIYNNGVTKENGTIKFNVSSSVPKKSVNSNVNQDSKIIVLNDKNNNEINPVLLIEEYESSARHAAFIGNFNKEELFYLMSRGLSKKEASDLLIRGLLIGTLDVCFNEKEILNKKLNEEWR